MSKNTRQSRNNRNWVDESKQDYNIFCVMGFAITLVTFYFEHRGFIGLTGAVVSAIGLYQYSKKHQRGFVFGVVGLVVGLIDFVYQFFIL